MDLALDRRTNENGRIELKKEEFEQMIKLMNDVINLRTRLEGESCQNHDCCDDDDEDEDDEGCPYMNELMEEYKEFSKWMFGDKRVFESTKKAKRRWEKLHPELPLPRVLLTESNISQDVCNLTLLFDALPHYLEYKKKCTG